MSGDDQLLVSKDLFESCIKNVTFESWEDFRGVVIANQTRIPHHGGSTSVVKLDPVRVFGWVAALLINVCIWGLLSYVTSSNKILGLLFVLCYGLVLAFVVVKQLSPALAGVLWPLLPCSLAAAGIIVCSMIYPKRPENRGAAISLLCWVILPQTLLAAYFLRGNASDPDRATLCINVFIGVWAALQCVYMLIFWPACADDDSSCGEPYNFVFGAWTALLEGIVAVVIAGRLFVIPSIAGSAEMVSWTLNIGVIAVFFSSQCLLGLPATEDFWRWFLFSIVVAGIGLIGAIFNRSLPILLTGVGCFMVAIYLSVEAAQWARRTGSPDGVNGSVVGLISFGVFGVALAVLVQSLWQSPRFAEFLERVRSAHSRAYMQASLELEDRRSTLSLPLGSQPGQAC
eukprot:TRINITY_DN39430_c0_g1_i1.p1 TRINITY_DN39430_c0_g1~~TRINITY_DN39430_c0_g1_i1.p1  ORF type:complete len:413 (-),score=69.83 TRINITY_DN39430_c0_g1_i1:163-1362(-)